MRSTPLDLIRPRRLYFVLVAALLATAGWPTPCLAHRVTIFAWVDGDTVYTQSRFSGGRAAKNGDITVFDAGGKQLLTGKTDAAGEFSFKLPSRKGLRIVLNAGMGHRNEWVLSADDLDRTSGGGTAEKRPAGTRPAPPLIRVPASTALTREDIQSIVDESLDKRLKPMMKLIAELRNDSPSVSDILGGIGYIIGLVGLAAYIQNRKRR
ncbi:MAG: hypothetical protein DSY90_01890 [Deltaproteobacteria bacterium]|nr:MAG: hypothetical protein DSY90_01890 [Deltaproteobacteria bacterium]